LFLFFLLEGTAVLNSATDMCIFYCIKKVTASQFPCNGCFVVLHVARVYLSLSRSLLWCFV
ncbi:MAG: hypothetical protein O7D30_08400, partial [Rickettsia endosymbiont of Ixodes persulcatus]|nr:hypothetical protein [Rickettsia endosymbiont of Ixodes persulcatus]